MLRHVWITAIIIVTLFNLSISTYMSYKTIDIAVRKCECAVNVYWYMIMVYFLLSGVFLLYLLATSLHFLEPRWMTGLLLAYLFATLGFAGGSFAYTKYLTSKSCDCVSKQYKSLLTIISFIRTLMAIVSLLALLIWGIYVLKVDRR